MNKRYYSFGNPFKIKFRKHYCYKCQSELTVIVNSKIVKKNSEEAKYFDFNIGFDGGQMIGDCQFIHKVFYCRKCNIEIEFVTQLSFEDVDVVINQVKEYFNHKGISVMIDKQYESKNGVLKNYFDDIDDIKYLILLITKDKNIVNFRIPLQKKGVWERPAYFKLKKEKLINFIKHI